MSRISINESYCVLTLYGVLPAKLITFLLYVFDHNFQYIYNINPIYYAPSSLRKYYNLLRSFLTPQILQNPTLN